MTADFDELRRLRRARDRMDREYAQPLDVPALARTALMSTAHFSRRFREAYSETPYSYLMTRRIERAKALLRRGDLLHRPDKGEAAMMDKGYDGITTPDPKAPDKNGPPRTCCLPHKARRGQPLAEEQKARNAPLSKYRVLVEHSLAQMNRFQALAQVFRHNHECHSDLTRIVAGLVNRRVAQRPLKTYPAA